MISGYNSRTVCSFYFGGYFSETIINNFYCFNCLFKKCKSKNKGGGLTLLGENREPDLVRVFNCKFIENKSTSGSGLWMEKFACSASNHEFDIVDSLFQKCSTNHDHGTNALSPYHACTLESINEFKIMSKYGKFFS